MAEAPWADLTRTDEEKVFPNRETNVDVAHKLASAVDGLETKVTQISDAVRTKELTGMSLEQKNERDKWRANMEAHLEKRQYAWDQVTNGRGEKLIIQKMPKHSVPDIGNSNFVAITEQGPVLLAAYGATINTGDLLDWEQYSETGFFEQISEPVPADKKTTEASWGGFNLKAPYTGHAALQIFYKPLGEEAFKIALTPLMIEKLDQTNKTLEKEHASKPVENSALVF